MFADRKEAGKKLAEKLAAYRGKSAVVLALPRGGVVLGYEVAKALKFPLDIIAVRKIGHPNDPEYAIGAVGEYGNPIMHEAEGAAIDQQWLSEETARQREEAQRRSRVYRGDKEAVNLEGKIAIIVDDGIATGFTMRIAVRSIKAQKPGKIVVAVPVAPPDSLRLLKEEGADEIIVLVPPEEFMGAVGAHYKQFEQVEDAEVIKLLRSV